MVNTNEAWSLGQMYAADHTSPRNARAVLVLDEQPGRTGGEDLYDVSRVRGRAFTFTFGLDQACLSWPVKGQIGVARPGACRPADRLDLGRTPLLAAAQRFGRLATDTAADPATGPTGLLLETTLRGEGVLAWMAPSGVRVTGVTDVDRDTVEDDGRVVFRSRGRTVCVQLPIRAGEKAQVRRGACQGLPTRDLSAVREQVRSGR